MSNYYKIAGTNILKLRNINYDENYQPENNEILKIIDNLPNRKLVRYLTKDEILYIRTESKHKTYYQVAKEINYDPSTVRKIALGLLYKNI